VAERQGVRGQYSKSLPVTDKEDHIGVRVLLSQ
jgi:hypothetical protein